MSEVYDILFSWAVTLSGYPRIEPPIVEFKPKSFFVKEACKGNENCKVVGWFSGDNVVYVWEKLDIDGSQIAASIVVHEYVHYLQDLNGKYTKTCENIVELEREAYGVQKEYLLRNGVFANGVGISVTPMHCKKE
ncbi:MAG TPA: hypothetical protein VIY47_06440 [Ignavibacteriaceae bacterium]